MRVVECKGIWGMENQMEKTLEIKWKLGFYRGIIRIMGCMGPVYLPIFY